MKKSTFTPVRSARRALPRARAERAVTRALVLATVAMGLMVSIATALLTRALPAPTERADRGDVPGWVMVTLMTAALVALLLAVAGPALEGLFKQAIDSVSKK